MGDDTGILLNQITYFGWCYSCKSLPSFKSWQQVISFISRFIYLIIIPQKDASVFKLFSSDPYTEFFCFTVNHLWQTSHIARIDPSWTAFQDRLKMSNSESLFSIFSAVVVVAVSTWGRKMPTNTCTITRPISIHPVIKWGSKNRSSHSFVYTANRKSARVKVKAMLFR